MTTFDAIFGLPIQWIVEQLEHLPAGAGRRAVVLVGTGRHAHALRRAVCVDRDRPDLFAGVQVMPPAQLAREILVRAGRVRQRGWEPIRRLRILHLFATAALGPELRYFNSEQLQAGHGYVEAFAHTIGVLEHSGLDAGLAFTVADQLAAEDAVAAARLRDVALTWTRADQGRGVRTTTAQLLAEAATVIAAAPALLHPFGAIFATLSESPATVLLRFLRALPGCRAVLHDARPLRPGVQRWRSQLAPVQAPRGQLSLFDPQARAGAAACTPIGEARPGTHTELQLVQQFLFATPETLTDPQRPRSAGADGSVDLEEHASLEEEVEASATWVIEQLAAGTAAEQMALIVPEIDPYAVLLSDRLQRLGTGAAALHTYIEGGVPLAASPAGQRVQLLLHALARSLEAEAVIRLLPALRRADQGNEELARPLSVSRAASLVYGAGIVGGSPADPDGAREWVPRLTRRRDTLRHMVESADADAATLDEPEKRRHTINQQQAQRRFNEIDALLPAVAALQQLAEAIVAGVPLRALWVQLRTFVQMWLRVPPNPPGMLATLEQQLAGLLADPVAADVTGMAALHALLDVLQHERRPTGRFGEPSIFIGTPAHAAGLPFAAVRLLGLAEGAVPGTPHDDPIVPDVLRGRIEAAARAHGADVVVPRLADSVLDDIHAAFRVISAAGQRLALSAPRQWIDRSDREVSGIMLEVATALGRRRHEPADGGEEGDVPTAARLRAAYLGPGRAARQQAAGAWPLSPRTQFTSIPRPSAEGIAVPAEWMGPDPLALDRVHALAAAARGTALAGSDGVISEACAHLAPPGLLPQRPISASALALLLGCPHRFLLERILHLNEPASRPSTDIIDPIAYGALFHAAAERLFTTAGRALCAHEGDVEQWITRAQAIAGEQFDQLRDEYPLRGSDAIQRERLRLLHQIEHLVRDEWQRPAREYLHSELGFGDPAPVRLEIDGGALFVRGAIDRLDRLQNGGLSVRDLKTGRVHDLGEDPMNAGRDLQIGVYTLVLESEHRVDRDAPPAHVTEAVYVHPSAALAEDRAFEGAELDLLRRRTRGWLVVAHRLLSAGAFPRTPNPDDCRYCPFVAACGEGAQQRSAVKLRGLAADHPLHAFWRFKEESRRDDG